MDGCVGGRVTRVGQWGGWIDAFHSNQMTRILPPWMFNEIMEIQCILFLTFTYF